MECMEEIDRLMDKLVQLTTVIKLQQAEIDALKKLHEGKVIKIKFWR